MRWISYWRQGQWRRQTQNNTNNRALCFFDVKNSHKRVHETYFHCHPLSFSLCPFIWMAFIWSLQVALLFVTKCMHALFFYGCCMFFVRFSFNVVFYDYGLPFAFNNHVVTLFFLRTLARHQFSSNAKEKRKSPLSFTFSLPLSQSPGLP